MNFISGLTKLAKSEVEEKQQQPSGETAAVPGATTDRDNLIASAKVVAQAAQEAASHGTETIDKPKVAGAAADLLDAASKYANLEGKGAGTLVDKAEEYLHQYGASGGGAAAAAPDAPPVKETETAAAKGEGEGGGGGSASQVLKLAQGLFNTEQPGGQGSKEE